MEVGYEAEMMAIRDAIANSEKDKLPDLMSERWLSDVTLYGMASDQLLVGNLSPTSDRMSASSPPASLYSDDCIIPYQASGLLCAIRAWVRLKALHDGTAYAKAYNDVLHMSLVELVSELILEGAICLEAV